MDTITLMCALLISCGVTCIITRGYVFHGLREVLENRSKTLGTLVNCPQCAGFWVGLGVGAIDVFSGGTVMTMLAITFGTSLLSPWLDPTRAWS